MIFYQNLVDVIDPIWKKKGYFLIRLKHNISSYTAHFQNQ